MQRHRVVVGPQLCAHVAVPEGAFDLVKVSYAALPWLLDDYHLLPCGGALGRGCGPLGWYLRMT